MKKLLQYTALSALLCSIFGMQSHAEQSYNHISFHTEVSQKVANDEMHVTLTKTSQANDAKTLANILNQTINQALAIAKKYPDVTVSTGHQSTYPRYNNHGKIIGFTGSASLNIHSKHFDKASELMAELQTMMTVDNLAFVVSDSKKETVEKQLMFEVAKRFQDEAKSISHAFGAHSYKIVNINLNSSNNYQPMPFRAKMATADASGGVEAQGFESGDSKLTYRASGTIELIK